MAEGALPHRRREPFSKRESLQYTTIQNNTCLLAPDVVWGPYAVDGEIYRYGVRLTRPLDGNADLFVDMMSEMANLASTYIWILV